MFVFFCYTTYFGTISFFKQFQSTKLLFSFIMYTCVLLNLFTQKKMRDFECNFLHYYSYILMQNSNLFKDLKNHRVVYSFSQVEIINLGFSFLGLFRTITQVIKNYLSGFSKIL